MTELQLLFLILVLLYAFECGSWLPRGSVGFVTWFGRHWHLRHPGALLGNQQGGVLFGAALPPLGTVLTASQWPMSLSAEGALAFVSTTINPGWRPRQTGRWVRFEDMRSVESTGKKVRVNGELFVRAATAVAGDGLAKTLREIAAIPAEKRAAAIERLVEASLDTEAIRGRWQDFEAQTAHIRFLTNVLFVYLFLIVPTMIWYVGLGRCWIGVVAGLLVLEITTALSFRRVHMRFYPRADEERFTHFLTTLLAPASTIRARDVLSRSLLEGFHPLAVAQVFCEKAEFAEFGRRVLRELSHPALQLSPTDEPAAQTAERESRARWLKMVTLFLEKNGLEPAALLQPPERTDPACLSYCPRCLAQFTTREGTCADCGGLSLVALPVKAG